MAGSEQSTGGYRPQDTGATAPPTVRNQPSSVQPPADPRDVEIVRLRRAVAYLRARVKRPVYADTAERIIAGEMDAE